MLEDDNWNRNRYSFFEFASQGSQCSADHWDYVLSYPNNSIIPLKNLRLRNESLVLIKFKECLDKLGDHIFVSFDIDSISSSDCPGVSAPGSVGLTAQEAIDICFEAGKNPKVCLFDLSEFNPVVEEYRTGKLVTLMFYNFALGLATRKQK